MEKNVKSTILIGILCSTLLFNGCEDQNKKEKEKINKTALLYEEINHENEFNYLDELNDYYVSTKAGELTLSKKDIKNQYPTLFDNNLSEDELIEKLNYNSSISIELYMVAKNDRNKVLNEINKMKYHIDEATEYYPEDLPKYYPTLNKVFENRNTKIKNIFTYYNTFVNDVYNESIINTNSNNYTKVRERV